MTFFQKNVYIYAAFRRKVKREDLQLIGATACLISCKIDERIPPLVVMYNIFLFALSKTQSNSINVAKNNMPFEVTSS